MLHEVLLKHKLAALVLEGCSINVSKKYYLNETYKGWGG